MKLLNIGFKKFFYISGTTNYKDDFDKLNCTLGLQRVMIISKALLVMSIFFFYADFIIFSSLQDKLFKILLTSAHILGILFSITFLLCYKKLTIDYFNLTLNKTIIRIFIFMCLLSATLCSIIGQRNTGNIDAYLIIVLVFTVTFPFEPIFMFFTLLGNHIFFLIGINTISATPYILISKQINSTTMIVVGFLLSNYLYKCHTKDFINKKMQTESEENFKRIFNITPLPLCICRYIDGKIITANNKACEFYGYTKDEFLKLNASELYMDSTDRISLLEELSNSTRLENNIVEHKTSRGEKIWIIGNYEVIEYFGEKCIVTSLTDITDLKKMENELLSHATTDILTGVLNRRKGIEVLRQLINSNDPATNYVLCFLDIDGLKVVNDKYGHKEGDNLIYTFCKIIKDIIKNEGIIFRFGGDEFVILFPGKNHLQVEFLWKKIKHKLVEENNSKHKPYNIYASHGLIEFSNNTSLTIEELLDLADKKMYNEKMLHKNSSILEQV